MNWLKDMLASSIGKKFFMAISGMMLLGFLVVHFLGNLTILGGPDLLAKYAHTLHSIGPLLYVAEFVLGSIFLAHILLGLTLFFQNRKARPEKYAVENNRGGETFASKTMPYSGLLILLFLITHLCDFTIQNYANGWTADVLAKHVFETLSGLGKLFFYAVMVIVVGVHVSHGFWSLFQSLGMGSVKCTKSLQVTGKVVGIIFAIGFGILPFVALALTK